MRSTASPPPPDLELRACGAGDATPEALLDCYRSTGDRRLRNRVVAEHRWLAVVIARDFNKGGEPLDDLIQVACVGLLKAAERFDPTYGIEFKTYAAVTAKGELRRHFRDATWSMHVPRRLQELRYEIRAAGDVLRERLGRYPRTDELAEYLKVEPDEILDCLCADENFRALTLDSGPVGGQARKERLGTVESAYGDIEAADAFARMLTQLPHRLACIVTMRYVHLMSQSEIASEIGVSQVHVSRLLRSAHEHLRSLLERQHEEESPVARP